MCYCTKLKKNPQCYYVKTCASVPSSKLTHDRKLHLLREHFVGDSFRSPSDEYRWMLIVWTGLVFIFILWHNLNIFAAIVIFKKFNCFDIYVKHEIVWRIFPFTYSIKIYRYIFYEYIQHNTILFTLTVKSHSLIQNGMHFESEHSTLSSLTCMYDAKHEFCIFRGKDTWSSNVTSMLCSA